MALKTIPLTSEQIKSIQLSMMKLVADGLNQDVFRDYSIEKQELIIKTALESDERLLKNGFQFDEEQNIAEFFEKLKDIKLKKYANSALGASHAGSF
jgi:hypothetical protein